MGRRQLCTYMYDVMSSSGVVVGVCGTWCAAWDGFLLCLALLLFTVYKRRSAVEEPRCVYTLPTLYTLH